MNSHADFYNDRLCPSCEPRAYREHIQLCKQHALDATADLETWQLQCVIAYREEEQIRKRVENLKHRHADELKQAQKIEDEIKELEKELKLLEAETI